ncbi:MAG: hypothetical protein ACREDC_06665 [Bradyrhizobium sp.]
MLIARRADTRARADFATWKMIAKLNGASSLPANAQNFLAGYKALLKDMREAEADEATIRLMYKAYYKEMGGVGTPPEIRGGPSAPAKAEPSTDNVTTFRRPPVPPKPSTFRPNVGFGSNHKGQLPVALIFMCLVIVYVGIRYLWQ